jgi:NAD-dependent DNA ligase
MARETQLSDEARTLQVMEVQATKHTRGRRICFTGHLGLARSEYQRIVEDAGMHFEKSVGYGLHYLCTNGDWTAGSLKGAKKSRKLAKAESLGVKIINEKQLLDLLSLPDDDD